MELTQLFSTFAQNPITFYLIVLSYCIISTPFGIGGFVLIPLVALYFGPKESIGIVTILFLLQNINKTIFFWKHIDWSIAKKMIIWSIPGVLIGTYILSVIPTNIFEKVLAIGILIFLTYDVLLKKKRTTTLQTQEHPLSLPFWGMFYGATSGLLGSGNMIKGPFLLSLGLTKEFYIGTYAVSSLFMNFPKTGMYIWTNIITLKTFITAIPFILFATLGTWLAKKILQKIESKMFYYILNSIYFGSAILLLIK